MVGKGRVNEGNESERIWLWSSYTYMKYDETSRNCFSGEVLVRGDGGDNLNNIQCKAIGNWHNDSPHYTMNLCQ
jgi:hypothetical protein